MLWNWDARSRPRLERVRKADHGAKALARCETLNAALKRHASTTLYATSSSPGFPEPVGGFIPPLASTPSDKKVGLPGQYESRQPKDCEPKGSAQVAIASGYLGDLAITAYPRFYCGGREDEQFGVFGGHSSMGPPSAAGTGWTAAATNVPTSPTIRIDILIARFMGSSPIRVEFSRRKAFSRTGIIGHVSRPCARIFILLPKLHLPASRDASATSA
jgi:hypothetical protein